MRPVSHAAVRVDRRIIGRPPIGRNLTVFPDNVFITSFPRSGSTWTRFLIGNLIGQADPHI